MKWYLTPAGEEFGAWAPRAIAKRISKTTGSDVALREAEPVAALRGDGWTLLPISDTPPTVPADRYISARYIRANEQDIADGEALAIYQTREKTAEMLDAEQGALGEQVTTERNRRIRAGFAFSGKTFDYDAASQQRITGAATLAGFAIGNGALADDLRWHGGDTDFVWIASDNSLMGMDAPTCFAFGQAAAAHESAHIFAARALKDMTAIPADFADDSYWP
ncbi:DUF4376 domain-containing protein [Aurantimonas coralicida]|uniref:DUF4376 domain-containing protein n=1 Tax=Aurantimonas coralicida TaxID=182270 RepID=UPI001E58B112|nr:DUF4376 domain-containing protein [Aurantimonas coralicida]MCD1644161.1 DUF4376 domain-containing protein [Aurantimonas coralicida]